MALWATVSDVRQITGRAVDTQDVAPAVGAVATVVDRDPDDATWYAALSSDDQRRLRQAVAWQTVFMAANPDALERDDVAAERFGDVSVENRGDTAAIVLAPLAQAAIRRLSWRRPRAIRLGTATQAANRNASGLTDRPGEAWQPYRPGAS